MSNAIKRCFMHQLSLDNASKDLDALAISNRKAEIVQKYLIEYSIDESHFTNEYWSNSGRFHFQSLQTLLGDNDSDWYKRKIIPFKSNIEGADLPLIQLECSQVLKGWSETLTAWAGELKIIINAKSSEDMTLGENISARIITILDQSTSIPPNVTIPNNLLSVVYELKGKQSGIDEYDTITLVYSVLGQNLEI